MTKLNCICGTPVLDESALETHYELAHPTIESPLHPDHDTFKEWRLEAVGR